MALQGESIQPRMARIKIIILAAIISSGILAVILALSAARTAAANQNRLADVSRIYEALHIFYDQNGYYPQGSPIPNGIGDYLDHWPTPPTPAGICSKTQDEYNYVQKSLGSDYEVTFCLSAKTEGLGSGMHTLSSQGIQ